MKQISVFHYTFLIDIRLIRLGSFATQSISFKCHIFDTFHLFSEFFSSNNNTIVNPFMSIGNDVKIRLISTSNHSTSEFFHKEITNEIFQHFFLE